VCMCEGKSFGRGRGCNDEGMKCGLVHEFARLVVVL
jgi:hypothetical protein